MPSSIAHSSVALLLSPLLGTRAVSRRLIAFAAVAAAAPDVDAISRPFGRGDIVFLGGHRATTHSMFVVVVAAIAAALLSRRAPLGRRLLITCYVGFVVASHGLLDALASYGDGVAFFAPIWTRRWKFGWQPFSNGVFPEMLFLWLPAAVVFVLWLRPRLDRSDISARTA